MTQTKKQTTPQQRQRARDEGRVALSHDLAGAISLLGSAAVLSYVAPSILDAFAQVIRDQWAEASQLKTDAAENAGLDAIHDLAIMLIILVVTFGMISISSRLSQIGFLFLPQRSFPDIERVNPRAGIERIFATSLSTIGFVIAKLVVIGVAVWHFLETNGETILAIPAMSVSYITVVTTSLIAKLSVSICVAMLFVGLADYWWRRTKLEQSLMDNDVNQRRNIRAISSTYESRT